jgi:hypothetical protein
MAQFIPKAEVKEKESTAVKALFWFAFIALIISGVLSYLADWKLNGSKQFLAELEEKASQVGTPEQKASKDSIANYKKKIDDIAELIKSHKNPTRIFDILESNIHPKVSITDMSYIGTNKQWKININGTAKDLISLAQQIMLFQQCSDIEKVSLSSVNTNVAQQVGFKMELTLKESSLIMQ